MKKKVISGILTLAMVFGLFSFMIPMGVLAAGVVDVSDYLIEQSDIPLRLYYDEEASHGVAQGYDDVSESFGSDAEQIDKRANDDWERWSIPLGNGYFGANIFGRTETERIQLTDKTLANPYYVNSISMGGVNNFSETYIDFGHKNSAVTNYSRELDLKTAVSTVSYKYSGVTYTREYFTSYPDRAMVIKLDASSAGALNFVLRPTIPYEQEYMNSPGDRGGKTGTVTSSVEGGVGSIVLSGTLEYFDIDFVGLYTVYTNGGTVSATTCTNADGDTDGTITVSGATGAYIVINLGTDYELCEETFTSSTLNKPTFSTDLEDTMAKVEGYKAATLKNINGKSYDDGYKALKDRHIADYSELFGRVTLDLNCKESDFSLTTDQLLTNYKNGSGSTYLEALYFQYGRYLLIASSRKGGLPANLQGTWNRYNLAPWSSGFWHNINVQMNYWPAFTTNIAETFQAYADYNNAYMSKAEQGASSIVNSYNPSMSGQDGGNGWSIETGGYVNDIYGSTSIGNLGFTTQLFWEYYEYTKDETILREVVYPVLVGAARFITKMVKEDADGNYIAIYTDSPEQYVDGVWYYTDKGTAYAQSFAYQNNYNMLLAAQELGIDFSNTTHEDYAIIQRVLEQLDKYDPIRVGLSGQVKEFFEEDYYGDLGEYTHRHISQLVGLYPGNVINGTTPAWLDAAKYTLTERGDEATGWGVAHRLNLWARVQDGERAHDLLEQLLSVNTATNLWDLHPPFQIDGNLGGTAGIAEMLLQSHAGYIEPLAAIPASWTSGSYTGLVARGNFEVSAKWADGLATSFNIKSLAGGKASVKYGGIDNAVVADSDGNVISYTVDGNDLISFNTEEGKTYVIYGFEKTVKPAKVNGLSLESEFLSKSTLTWQASSDAVSYNVYVAKDNAPAYTLLTNTRGTTYTYLPGELENSRLTFAVTAVNANGTESDRTLVYRNPDDTSAYVESVSANVVDGNLQVAIEANEYAAKFKLYSKTGTSNTWSQVAESSYPIIIDETYDSSRKYGVSVVSYFGGESEISEITAFNSAFDETKFNASNIFEGKVFIPTAEGNTYKHGSAAYGDYGKLTDNNFIINQGRFSTKASANDVLEGVISLPTTFLLGELKLYDFNGSQSSALYAGGHLKVDVFLDGKWTTVAEYNSNAEILALCKSDVNGNYIAVDLSLVTAQQIRVRIDSPVKDTEQRSISLNEIQCTGIALNGGRSYSENILLGKEVNATPETETWTALDGGGASNVSGITDGTYQFSENSKWWRTWYGKENMTFDGTIDLKGTAYLGELRIYYYATWLSVGPDIEISVYADGVWTTVYDLTLTSSNIGAYQQTGDVEGNGNTESWLSFDMSGVYAEKLRIYLPPKSTAGQNYGMYEVTLGGYYEPEAEKVYNENLLLGQSPYYTDISTAISSNATYGTYGFDKLTDNIYIPTHDGRFAINAGTNNYATVAYSLQGNTELETLTIWDFYDGSTSLRSNETTIELLVNDEWVKYMDAEPLWTSASGTTTSGNGRKVVFDLTGYTADAIRITFKNTNDTNGITIQEIQLSGYLKAFVDEDSERTEYDNILSDKTFVAAINEQMWYNNPERLTDGDYWNGSNQNISGVQSEPRYATLSSSTKGIDISVELGGLVYLNELRIKDHNGWSSSANYAGNAMTIQVKQDGNWVSVYQYTSNAAILAHRKTYNSCNFLIFDMNGIYAEALRIIIPERNGSYYIALEEIECSATVVTPSEEADGPVEDESSNILLGTTADQLSISGATIHSGAAVKDLSNAFDGKLNTRFAVWDASPYAYSLTIELNATYPLYTLSIYPFHNQSEASRSDKTSVEVYLDGAWIKVVDNVVIANSQYTDISLGGVKASKLRINFANTTWNASASIYEIKCTTGTTTAIDRSALLDAYIALDNINTDAEFGLDAVKEERLAELRELLMDTGADQVAIDAYVTEVSSAADTLAAGAPVTDEYGDFTSYNLSLTGNIGFNFYGALAADVETAFPDAYVLVQYADGTTERHLIADLSTDGSGRHIVKLNMVAAQMTDKVKLRLILDGSNCGEYIEQSISDYANIILGDSSYEAQYPGITDMVTAMLNYGAYAQEYFGHNTDNLANAGVETSLDGVADNSAPIKSGSATGLTMKSWTLSLESEVAAKIYFTLESDANINSYTATLAAPDGKTTELAFEQVGSRYRVIVENIVSGYLDNDYIVVITNNNDGSSVTFSFSAMCYVSQTLASSDNPALINLVKALKLYSNAANAYFG